MKRARMPGAFSFADDRIHSSAIAKWLNATRLGYTSEGVC